MTKSEKIEQAIIDGCALRSKLPITQMEVPALTSIRLRHIYNNIGKLGTVHFEVGPHRGGSYTATIAGSDNLKYSFALDSFESDKMGVGAKNDFLRYSQMFMPKTTKSGLIVSDCFKADISLLPDGIDLYTYDGDHSYESQKKALTYFKDKLADEFIFMCDDYDWDVVEHGTQDGIEEGGYKILYEQTLKGNDHDNDGFWNGYYIALLRK